jgi:hypothetical protein
VAGALEAVPVPKETGRLVAKRRHQSVIVTQAVMLTSDA